MKTVVAASVLLFAALGTSQGLADRIRSASSQSEAIRATHELPKTLSADPNVMGAIGRLRSEPGKWKKNRDSLAGMVDAFEAIDGAPGQIDTVAARQKAKAVLADQAFKETQERHERNLLANAGDQVTAWLKRLIETLFPKPNVNDLSADPAAFSAIVRAVWVLAALTLIVLVVLAIKAYRRPKVAKIGRGLLEEDEPDRTADEWLQLADRQKAEGALRLAVRSLYLAHLLRLSEYGRLEFVRHETNWEHIWRFRESGSKYEVEALTAATTKFDPLWYGERRPKEDDVEWFRDHYKRLMASLGGQ